MRFGRTASTAAAFAARLCVCRRCSVAGGHVPTRPPTRSPPCHTSRGEAGGRASGGVATGGLHGPHPGASAGPAEPRGAGEWAEGGDGAEAEQEQDAGERGGGARWRPRWYEGGLFPSLRRSSRVPLPPCSAPRPGGPVSVDIELNQARLLWTVVRAARQGVSEVSRGTSRPRQWQVPARLREARRRRTPRRGGAGWGVQGCRCASGGADGVVLRRCFCAFAVGAGGRGASGGNSCARGRRGRAPPWPLMAFARPFSSCAARAGRLAPASSIWTASFQ